MLNRSELRIVPCPIPKSKFPSLEYDSPIFTFCVRPVRNDLNQSSALPLIPISYSRILIRIFWSTVSKAALRSRSKTTVG